MVKKILFLTLTLSLVFLGSTYAVTKEVAAVYKAAEKEGQLLVVTSLNEKEIMPMINAFNEEHPKIKARYKRQHGGRAMESLMREIQAGIFPRDVVYISADYVYEFLKMDVIEKVNWADFGVPPEQIHHDGRFVEIADSPFAIIYNKNLIKPEEAPKNWEDFLDPKWKGRFIVDRRPSAFLRLTGAWGPEKVLDYLRKLGQNKPIFVRGQLKYATLMAAGDYEVAVAMYLHSYVRVAEQKGGPLGFNLPNPLPTTRYNLCILKGIKNPNAAKVFLGWMGKKGSKMMEDSNWGRAPVFKGSRKEKLYKGLTLSYPPTPEQVPDSVKYTQEMVKAMGVSPDLMKKKKKKK